MAERALCDACDELRGDAVNIDPATRTMAKIKILAALVDGERNPENLKAMAIAALK